MVIPSALRRFPAALPTRRISSQLLQRVRAERIGRMRRAAQGKQNGSIDRSRISFYDFVG